MKKELSPKQLAAMQADPNYRNFVLSGDSTRVSVLVSMIFLMQSVANGYAEQAVSLMRKHKMVYSKVKTTTNNLSQSFDSFDKCIFALIKTQESQNILCHDYDNFQAICDHFMNIDKAMERFTQQHPSNPQNPSNNENNETTQQD